MAYEEVKLPKGKLIDSMVDWINKNPDAKYPTTSFYDSLGLFYLRVSYDGDFILCRVEDQKKYFVTKIKYGF